MVSPYKSSNVCPKWELLVDFHRLQNLGSIEKLEKLHAAPDENSAARDNSKIT